MKTIIEALEDPNLFGAAFPDLSTWSAWRSFLGALFGLPMSKVDVDIYSRHTARERVPSSPFKEAWLPIGRRGGKSRIAALIAVYVAAFRDYRKVLSAGERGVAMIIAQDRQQARVIFKYVEAFIDGCPMLASMVRHRSKESIELSNRVSIEIHTCSFRAVRGYTIVAAICDEIAFWRDDSSANPDEEILSSIRPGMATVPDSLLLCISSPYARRGALWNAYKKHYGQESPVLVWQADTASMNPTISTRVLSDAYEVDEASASAEYGALFRKDIESFVSREAVEQVTVAGRLELPYLSAFQYQAFVDPSGGSADSMTLAIAHVDGDQIVLDAVRERIPPFSPDVVTQEFAATLKEYRLSKVTGDRYAGEWPRERFREYGITYELAPKTKSEIYGATLPLINSGRAELLDQPRLLSQLLNLERKTTRSGRDSIDHAPNGRDDVVNAAAGVLVLCAEPRGFGVEVWGDDAESWRRKLERDRPGVSRLETTHGGRPVLEHAEQENCEYCKSQIAKGLQQ